MRHSWRKAVVIIGLSALTAGPALAETQDGEEGAVPADPIEETAPVDTPEDTTPAATTAETASGSASVGYKKGFFITSADDKFSLVTQGRVQGRAEWLNQDGANKDNFSIARARLTLKGHAFSKDIKYKFQSDFGKGNVVLKDFYVDWKVGEKAIVRVGQYKRPFSRQQINSSGRLELVDRAITDKEFGGGRDIGVMVHNNYEKSPELEWAFGVFNGTGDKAAFDAAVDPATGEVDVKVSNVPDQMQPAFVARAGINRGGIKGYSEADLEGGPMRFAVGGSVLVALDNDADDESTVRAEVDGVMKQNGLSVSGAVFVATAQDGEGFADQAMDKYGAHAQAGYMLNKKHQAVARYAVVIPDADGEDPSHEITGGFSLYEFAHGFKWQTDLGARVDPDDTRILARTQLQLSF